MKTKKSIEQLEKELLVRLKGNKSKDMADISRFKVRAVEIIHLEQKPWSRQTPQCMEPESDGVETVH